MFSSKTFLIGLLSLAACGNSANPYAYTTSYLMRQGGCVQAGTGQQVSCNPEVLVQGGIDPGSVQGIPVTAPGVLSKYDSASPPYKATAATHLHWNRLHSSEQIRLVRQAEAYFVQNPQSLDRFGFGVAGTAHVPGQVLYAAIQTQTDALNYSVKVLRGRGSLTNYMPLMMQMRDQLAADRVVWCMQQPKKCPKAWKVVHD